jgi:hypothetical protein
LSRAGAEFYRLMCRYPDIELSDAPDQVVLSRSGAGDLELVVTNGGRETLRRLFRARETEELRLHLNGGTNQVTLRGAEHSGVGIRITAGSGPVELHRAGSKTQRVVLYARPRQVKLEPVGAVRLVPHYQARWIRWRRDDLPPVHPDWGTRTTPIAQVGLGGDLGLVLGGGVQWLRYGFGEPDYRQRLRAEVHYLGVATRFGGSAGFERRNVLRNLHLSTEIALNRMAVVRYFGEGNDSPRAGGADFHRVDARDLTLRAGLAVSARPEVELRLSPVLELASTDTSVPNTQLAASHPYGSGNFDAVGIEAGFRYHPARARTEPGLGVAFTLEGSIYPEWLDLTRGAFGVIGGEGRVAWVPSGGDARLMFAGRVGGGLGMGTVPFNHALRIGGVATLRGYQTDRFTADRGAAYGAVELRLRTARAQVGFATLDLGLLAFGDAGRLWSRRESSSTIHTSFGGGWWAAPALGWIPALDALVLRADVARSIEGTTFSVGTGFRF